MHRLPLVVITALAGILSGLTTPAQDDARKPMTVEDLWAMGRVADPQISPDGKSVAFSVTWYDMEKNDGETAIYLVSIAGGPARRLTAVGHSASGPRFSPDGKSLYFRSARGPSLQIWRLPLEGGGEAEQVTRLPVDITGFSMAPDGKHLLVTALVYPDAITMEQNKKRYATKAARKTSARVYTRLLYRHWNHWRDARRSHVLLYDLENGNVRDLTPGDHDSPPVSLEFSTGYDLSPDGDVLVFSRNATKEPAVNTNNDIFAALVKGGSARQLTRSRGNDHSPHISPNGKLLGYLSMKRPGFEADRNVLMAYRRSTGKDSPLTGDLDRSVSEYVWARDSRSLYFTAVDQGRTGIYAVDLINPSPRQFFKQGTSRSLRITPDGKTLVFTNQAFDRPPEVWSLDIRSGKALQLSHINDAILARLKLGKSREFWFKGAKSEDVHGFLLEPPGFDPGRNYPGLMLIHGGPQGAFMDDFHWRWNAQLWVASGCVGIIINFHGSRGYGQKFCDAVSRDWGGAPYEDIMKGLDYVVNRFGFIDRDRVGAAGGSYGGFMVNWIAGQTDRFKCLISHAGLAEHWSMFGATEEIWFPQWEFGGRPWEAPELHEKWSPVRYARNFKTPMLIIHGEQDYRVPYTQALQMFTALRIQGVKAKLVIFPDECHFITRPQNARFWWNTNHAWLTEHLSATRGK